MHPTKIQAKYANIRLQFIIQKIQLAYETVSLNNIEVNPLAEETTTLSADEQKKLVINDIQSLLAFLKTQSIKESFGALDDSSAYGDVFQILNNLDNYFNNELRNGDKTEEYYKLELDYLKGRIRFLTDIAKKQNSPFTDLKLTDTDDTAKQLQTLTDWAITNGMSKPSFYANEVPKNLKNIFINNYSEALQEWLSNQEKTLGISKLKGKTENDEFEKNLRRQMGKIHPGASERTKPTSQHQSIQPASTQPRQTETITSHTQGTVEKWHLARTGAINTVKNNWHNANTLTLDTVFILKLFAYLITSLGLGGATEGLRRVFGTINLGEISQIPDAAIITTADLVQANNINVLEMMRNFFPQPGDLWKFLPFFIPLVAFAMLLASDRTVTAESQRRSRKHELRSLEREWHQQKILQLANLGHISYADDPSFSSIEFAEALIRYKMEGPHEFHDPEFIADTIAALYFGHKKIEPPDPEKWKSGRALKRTGHKKAEKLQEAKPTTESRQLADRLLADLPGDSKFQAKFLTQLKKATPRNESQNLRRIAYNIALLRPETYQAMKMDTLVDAITLLVSAPTWQQQKTAADFLSNFSFSHLDTLRDMIVHLWDNNGASKFRGLFAEMLNAIEKTNTNELACDIFVQKIFAAFLGNPLDGWIKNRYSKMDAILSTVMQTVDIHKSTEDETPGYAFIYENLVKKALHSKFAYFQSAAPTIAGSELRGSLLQLHENRDNYLRLLTFIFSPWINPDHNKDFALELAKRFSESLQVVKKAANEETHLLDDAENPEPELINARNDLITAYLNAGNDADKVRQIISEDEFTSIIANIISLIDINTKELRNAVTPLDSSITPPAFADARYQNFLAELNTLYQNLLLTPANTRATVTISAVQRVLAADEISEIDRGLLLQALIRAHLANKIDFDSKQHELQSLIEQLFQSLTLTEAQKDRVLTTLFYSTVDSSRKALPLTALFKQLFNLNEDQEKDACNRLVLECHKKEHTIRTAQASYFLYYRDSNTQLKTIERMLAYTWNITDKKNQRAQCFNLAILLLRPILIHEGKKTRGQQIIFTAQIIRAYTQITAKQDAQNALFGDFELQRWVLESYANNNSAKAIFAAALDLAIKDIALKQLQANFQKRAEQYLEAAKYLITFNNENSAERTKYQKKLTKKFNIFCENLGKPETDIESAYKSYAKHFRNFQQETTGILKKALNIGNGQTDKKAYAELCIAEQILASAKVHPETAKMAEDFSLHETPLLQNLSTTKVPAEFTKNFSHAAKLLPLLQLSDDMHHTTLASSFRSVPGLANFSNHKFTAALSEKCKNEFGIEDDISLCTSRYRSSLIVPPPSDVSKADERKSIGCDNIKSLIAITQTDTKNAFKNIWQTEPPNIALIQTLISPLIVPGIAFKAAGKSNNDETTMALEKNSAIEAIKNAFVDTIFINTNYMLNKMRTFSKLKRDDIEQLNTINKTLLLNQIKSFIRDTVIPNLNEGGCKTALDPLTKTEPQNWKVENMQAVLDAFNDNNNLSKQQKLHLALLINATKDYLDIDKQQAENDRHRELFFASLEQIIVENIGGIAYGSCKSGKDRKGCEVLHTDAMQLYFARYGQLPRYDDSEENRQKFIAIFATLFFTEHQQEVADQNAPGANGMKNLELLPKDILNYLTMNPRMQVYKLSSNLNKPKINRATPIDATDSAEENEFIDSLLNILEGKTDAPIQPNAKDINIYERFMIFIIKNRGEEEGSRASWLEEALMIVSMSEKVKTIDKITIFQSFWNALTNSHTHNSAETKITEDLGKDNNLDADEIRKLAIICQAHIFAQQIDTQDSLQTSLTTLKEFLPITIAQIDSNNYPAYFEYFQYLFVNPDLTNRSPNQLLTKLLNMTYDLGYEKEQARISILHGYLRALYDTVLKNLGNTEIDALEDIKDDASIIPQLHRKIEPAFIDGLYAYLSQPMTRAATHLASLDSTVDFLSKFFAPFDIWIKNIKLMAELRSLIFSANSEPKIADNVKQLHSFISSATKNCASNITIEEFSATGRPSHISFIQLFTTFFTHLQNELERQNALKNLVAALVKQGTQEQIIQRVFAAYIMANNKENSALDPEQLKSQVEAAKQSINIRSFNTNIFAADAILPLLQSEAETINADDADELRGKQLLPITSGFFNPRSRRIEKTANEFQRSDLTTRDINPHYMYENNDIEKIRELFINNMLPIGQRGYRDGNNLLLKYATDAIKTIAILPAISESAASRLSRASDFQAAFQQIKRQEAAYPARILFNINTGNHWILGEVNITKNAETQINIEMTAHNPYGGGSMPMVIQNAIKAAANSEYPAATFTTPVSTFNKRQYDGTSCGVISVQDLILRIQNKSLNTAYAHDAKELRLSHLSMQKDYDSENTTYQFYYKQFHNIQNRFLSYHDLAAKFNERQQHELEGVIQSFNMIANADAKQTFADNLYAAIIKSDNGELANALRAIGVTDSNRAIMELILNTPGTIDATIKADVDVIRIAGLIIYFNTFKENAEKLTTMQEMLNDHGSFFAQDIYKDYKEIMLEQINKAMPSLRNGY